MNTESSLFYTSTNELILSQPFIDSIPNGLLITDTQCNLIMVNRWISNRLRLDTEEIYGKPLGEVFPELTERNLLEAFRLVLQSSMPLTLSNRIHRYFIKMPVMETYKKMFDEMPQSVVISPLIKQGKLIGTVTSILDVTERVITEQTIQNEVQKMNVLHEIDQALSTLDIEQVLQTIIQNSFDLFNAESATLFLVNDNEYKIAIQKNEDEEEIINRELLDEVVQKRSSLSRKRENIDARLSKGKDPLLDLAAPLIAENQLIGVLSLVVEKNSRFPAQDIQLLDSLASRAAMAIFNARLHRKETTQRKTLESLKDIAINLTSELDPSVVLDSFLDSIAVISPFDSARLLLIENDQLSVVRHLGYDAHGFSTYWDEHLFEIDDFPYLQTMKQSHQPVIIPDTNIDPQWRSLEVFEDIHSAAGAPIYVRRTLLGFLLLEKKERGFYTDDYVSILGAFSMQAGIALENARLYNKQKNLASVDGLTGIANRRSIDKSLFNEVERGKRYNHNTSLIMIDIDHFKKYNDTFGHLVGDAVLKNVALLIQQNLRLVDIFGRYGGEEFMIILPETESEKAAIIAERLREKVSAMHLNPPLKDSGVPDQPVTISLGVSTAPGDGSSPEVLINTADQALYQAKKLGRNKVCIYKNINT